MSMREQILRAKDRTTAPVPTPEWSGEGIDNVWVRSLTAKERIDAAAKAKEMKEKGQERYHAVSCAYFVCDENGERIFSDDDIEALHQKSGPVLDRIINAAFDLVKPTEAETKGAEKKS